MKGDDPLIWSNKKKMIILNQMEGVSMQLHHKNLPFYAKYVIISKKKTEINRDFRKKRLEIFRDKMRF